MTKRIALNGFAVLAVVIIGACGEGKRQEASGQTGDEMNMTGTSAPNGAAAGSGDTPKAGSGTTGNGSNGSGTPNGAAAGSGKPADAKPSQPPTGQTDFVSADMGMTANGAQAPSTASAGAAGTAAAAPAQPPGSLAADSATASNRAVERGDIYRVLDDHRILNLNSYRGLQVIDISDVSAPRIEGRLAVTGDPVEMYVVGEQAIVLLNNWQGYYGSRDDVAIETVRGGLVVSIDIHDRAHPQLVDQTTVRGTISTSRLTQGDGQAALYVAATNYNDKAEAVVKSFAVDAGKFTAKTELNLGGYVQDIAATTDLLMVASLDYAQNQNRSQVAIIDISQPDGTMVRGATVYTQGIVQNKFNMDAYNGVLRIASGADWNGTTQNHLETFDLSDLKKLAPLDHCTFGMRSTQGASEMLYATAFVENRAFFVTYYRRDPFHAFSIDDRGRCKEHNEFIVSGWNDFLRPTLNDTRLIGIGHNDQNSTLKLSVSLYDAENLSNPNPLRARADIDLAGSYSEATWDDRGFSVLEGAVSVKAPDGTMETGLVLLPFQAWDQNQQTQLAQVQIFTFSDHTLTKRGRMDHGSSVRRSFMTDATTTANLSEELLSLFDTSNPDAPKALGRVDVAPNYTRVFVVGDYIARVKDRGYYNYWQPANKSVMPVNADVQIVPRSIDPDTGAAVASFAIPTGSDVVQVGKLLVSVFTASVDATGKTPVYHTQIKVHDLSDAEQPKLRGSLETDRLTPGYSAYVGLPVAGCFDCGFVGSRYGYGYGSPQRYVVGDAIAFVGTQQQQQSLGRVHQCNTYVSRSDFDSTTCQGTFYSGGITCTTVAGGKEQCTGSIDVCDASGVCKPGTPPPSAVQTYCNDYDQSRYWQSYVFDALDLRNPDAPVLAARVSAPKEEQGSSIVASGGKLFVNHGTPYTMKDSTLSHLKRFVRVVDFSDPQHANLGDAVNVPGDVIAVDGSTLYTRDEVWTNAQTRTQLARLTLSGKLAYLQASRLFSDRSVDAVVVDGSSHVLVSNAPRWSYPLCGNAPIQQPAQKLTILDAQSLDQISEVEVDQWGTLVDAEQGRALFRVGGGLLLFDARDAMHPKAQAYFPTQSWPSEILFEGSDILFAGGPYGVYRFDASVFNLLTK